MKNRVLFTPLLAVALAMTTSPARAQLASVSNATTGSSCSVTPNNTTRFCGFATSFPVANTGTTFTSKYGWNVNADVGSGTQDLSSTATHTLSFQATAVGGYRLDIVQNRLGDLNRVGDGGNGSLDITGVTGSSNISLSTGTLNAGDIGGIGTGSFSTNSPIENENVAASIFRVSNGAAQSHTLTFTWSGNVRSNTAESAIRLGLANGTTTSCSACDYPGSPTRTLANDGHFIQVTLVPLCGNGTIDAQVSEQCDEGAANGTATSCCNANCTFKTAGTQCGTAAGICDVDDFCTGAAGACPPTFQPGGTLCRAGSGDLCDPDEVCTGAAANCPADTVASAGTVCNPGSGDSCDPNEVCSGNATEACPSDTVTAAGTLCRAGSGDMCDPDEVCTGVADQACPADTIAPSGTVCDAGSGDMCDTDNLCTGTAGQACPADSPLGAFVVCRPGSGDLCDPDELCPGVADQPCPADTVTAAGTLCRAEVPGGCDIADNCTGNAGEACPADATVSAGTECRATAGICDVAEQCDGSNACPADARAPTSTSCRAAVDVCDAEDFCDGTNVACPADGKLTTVCRPAADLCDVDDVCDGSNDACPADAVAPTTTQCRVETDDCDTPEFCDGVAIACPAEVTIDGDGDGTGDGCDGCNNIGPVFTEKPKVRVWRLGTPGGDDQFLYRGFANLPNTPTINPYLNGARVIIVTATNKEIVDAYLPPGTAPPIFNAGWKVSPSGKSFAYKNRGLGIPSVDGVGQFKVKLLDNPAGRIKFLVRGKHEHYQITTGDLPLRAQIIIDPPVAVTGQCSEALFLNAAPNPGTCLHNPIKSEVKCK